VKLYYLLGQTNRPLLIELLTTSSLEIEKRVGDN
jgi:hypothetical protein